MMEICILAIFFGLVLVAALLWEDLKSKGEEFEDSDRDPSVMELDQWGRRFDAFCLLVEQINRCYGIILVVFVGHSVIYLIHLFPHVFMKDNSQENKFRGGKNYEAGIMDMAPPYMDFFTFMHESLRFFIVVVISHRIESQVNAILEITESQNSFFRSFLNSTYNTRMPEKREQEFVPCTVRNMVFFSN